MVEAVQRLHLENGIRHSVDILEETKGTYAKVPRIYCERDVDIEVVALLGKIWLPQRSPRWDIL